MGIYFFGHYIRVFHTMIMRKLYLEMAQIIIGSFLFDKQWGRSNGNNNWERWYPIAFTEACFIIVANDASAFDKSFQYIGINNFEKDKFKMYTSSGEGLQMSYVAMGK